MNLINLIFYFILFCVLMGTYWHAEHEERLPLKDKVTAIAVSVLLLQQVLDSLFSF
jgi:hypothetical protein